MWEKSTKRTQHAAFSLYIYHTSYVHLPTKVLTLMVMLMAIPMAMLTVTGMGEDARRDARCRPLHHGRQQDNIHLGKGQGKKKKRKACAVFHSIHNAFYDRGEALFGPKMSD